MPALPVGGVLLLGTPLLWRGAVRARAGVNRKSVPGRFDITVEDIERIKV